MIQSSTMIRARRSLVKRPHWSYSQINQYRRCPLQYYFERIERRAISYTTSGLAFGSAIHRALAAYHLRLQYQHVPRRDEIVRTFLDAWKEIDGQRPIQLRPGETEADLLELGRHLLGIYIDSDRPAGIVAVEQVFVVPIVNSQGEFMERPLVAIVDLLRVEDGDLVVDEFKTASRKPSQSELDAALQATCYAFVIDSRNGMIPSVRYTTFVKTKRPQIHRSTTERTPSDLRRLGDLIETIGRAIEAEIFYPNESPQNCSTCPFRKPCREWSGSRDSASPAVDQLGALRC